MSKQHWKGSVLLAPVPAVLVTVGTLDAPNVLTIAWTGILASHPPTTYISVRPERYSYDILQRQREFVINLPTAEMEKAVDFCGIRSGKNTDKMQACHLTLEPSETVAVPSIVQCPINLECHVTKTIPLGSHTVFIAEITGVNVDESYLDKQGKLNLSKKPLLAYAHGEYFQLGEKIGTFGDSVRKKKRHKGGKS